jgi:hypothetical protein
MTGDFRAAVLRGSLREHLRTTDNVQPTLPSRLIEMSFRASTANSIGRCCKTLDGGSARLAAGGRWVYFSRS